MHGVRVNLWHTAFPPTSLALNEKRLILGVLQESNWNNHEAARRLKISRRPL
ncbi:MAG: hypothetical protein JRC67_07560 [Deltaproteobacteria bacterium]|nr:hypothetical protein [Deltaproteobacteria bacterium]MBW2624620.1 hypothetical protein [Deltaproteobacteria bacterium]MBW2722063.1 hypothetical protein [Deltaproteobacteria bacterium]